MEKLDSKTGTRNTRKERDGVKLRTQCEKAGDADEGNGGDQVWRVDAQSFQWKS